MMNWDIIEKKNIEDKKLNLLFLSYYHKIIIGILKPILLLSIVKLIQVNPEYIQI